MYYIGKIDKEKIGKFADKIINEDLILTEERRLHIYNNHTKDYKTIIDNLDRVALNPNEIIEDHKNENTLFFVGKIDNRNLNIVIKLNTTNSIEHPKNSVMTSWLIRNRNLKKLRDKNKVIYKNE